MTTTKPKTVRFSAVVKRSGKPQVHTLWTAPKQDAQLQRAAAAHRVMTIAAGRGKADVGSVGFQPRDRHRQLLIFPKSLKPFAGARVVGLKFDLVEQPVLTAAGGRATLRGGLPASRRTKDTVAPPPPARPAKRKTDPDAELKRSLRDALADLQRGRGSAARRRVARALAEK